MLRAVVGVSQGAKQGSAFLQGQGLGAGGGLYSGLGEGGAQARLRIVGLEIVPQGLALLAEGELEEVDEAVFYLAVFHSTIPVEAQFFLSGSDGEAQGGGMYFGRGRKCRGRQSEEFFDAGIELGGGRKQAIVAATGFGGNAICYFALDENYDGVEVFGVVKEAQQYLGSDVVGKVADDLCRFRAEFETGTAQAGFGSEQGIEIDRQDVSLDDFDVGEHAEAEAELRGQHAVELDGDESADALGQEGSEDAASGADFEDGVLRCVAEGVDDLPGRTFAGEEMLSQLGLVLRTTRGHDLRHVDPLFLGHIDWLCPATDIPS
jgi:hypothetical protein